MMHRIVSRLLQMIIVGAVGLPTPRALAAQGLPTGLPADRRLLVETELAESRVVRVKTRRQTIRLRDVRLVGDSLFGQLRAATPTTHDGAPAFRAHLADVLVIERRNLRRSLGWGVALGGLVGYLHARALETKDKLDPATTQRDEFYTRQALLLTGSGAVIGAAVGALFPAWDLLHSRRR